MNRPHGRYSVSISNPRSRAVCDFCGFIYNRDQLRFQYQWMGPRLQNLKLLVCPTCSDRPQEQLRTIVLPPDPVPIDNPRPEFGIMDDNPASAIGTPIGTLTGFGGLAAAYDSNTNKPFNWSAAAQINPQITPPSTTGASLNFSIASNSMYIPLLVGTV